MVLFGSGNVQAEEVKPFDLALWSPCQIQTPKTSIEGLRISLFYGESKNVTGVDLSLIASTIKGNFKGYGNGLFKIVDGNASGWLDCGINIVKGDMVGLQTGLYNSANKIHGVQLGLINMAEALKGVQIGLLNFNRTGKIYFFPIINFSSSF